MRKKFVDDLIKASIVPALIHRIGGFARAKKTLKVSMAKDVEMQQKH
jgi:hypothetical protein